MHWFFFSNYKNRIFVFQIITVQFWLFCCPQKSKVAKLLQLKVRIRWPRNVNPKWFLRSHKANKGCCTNPTTVGEWTLVWWISRFAWIVMEPKMNFSVGLIGQFLPLEHSHLLLLRVQSMIMNDCNKTKLMISFSADTCCQKLSQTVTSCHKLSQAVMGYWNEHRSLQSQSCKMNYPF